MKTRGTIMHFTLIYTQRHAQNRRTQQCTMLKKVDGFTGGESSELMALGELNVEEGDESMEVVIASYTEMEWGREWQVFLLDCVHVNLLENKGNLVQTGWLGKWLIIYKWQSQTYNFFRFVMIIITEVFIQHKILSGETTLRAYMHECMDYTQLNIYQRTEAEEN